MTETRQFPKANWTHSLLGLCACLFLVWGCRPYMAPSATTAPVEDIEESTDAEETPAVDAGKSPPATSDAKTPVDGAKATEKPPLGQVTILVPTKKFKKEGPKKALRLESFDDIDLEKVLNTKTLTVDLPNQMPDWLKDLNGKRIRVRGYMHPASAFTSEGIKRFTFCRDTSACCFGPDPTIYYLIQVTMKSGTSTEYVEREAFDVEGTFRIEPIVQERSGQIAEFYHLDDAQIVKR